MRNEKRLIDPDEFLQWLAKRFKCIPLVGSCDRDSESMKLLLVQAPTVAAVEVVYGQTEEIKPCQIIVDRQCCLCGTAMGREDNYCPNCGAKMDKEEIRNDENIKLD